MALGRALLAAPQILLMTSRYPALDLGLKQEILPYLETLKQETKLPILYVSHDIDEVARLADRVVLLEQGMSQPPQRVAEALSGAAPVSGLGRAIGRRFTARPDRRASRGRCLTELRIGSECLWLPGLLAPIGGNVQLRIEARDVTISVGRPEGLSALNVLPVTIRAVDPGPGAGALLRLEHEGQAFAARLTARSVRLLGLAPGQNVYAVLKTMSVAQARVSARPA